MVEDFVGKAPDLGAHEFGKPAPHYGPRNAGAAVTVDSTGSM